AVAFHQFQGAMEDCLRERVAGGAAVGAGDAVGPLVRLRVVVIAERSGQVAHLAPRQRPDGRPLNFPARVEGHGDKAEATGTSVEGFALTVLALAEEQTVVEGHGSVAEFGLARRAARLVAPEHAGMALESLAQRASPGLCIAGALASAH